MTETTASFASTVYGIFFINDIPYFLQGINDILVREIPRVWLLRDPPKEGRDEVFVPTILLVNIIRKIFVGERGLSATLSTRFVSRHLCRSGDFDFHNALGFI